MKETRYIHIDLKEIPLSVEFLSFNLYVHNDVNNEYTCFVHSNSPFDSNKRSDLENFLIKGASLAIKESEKELFLISTQTSAESFEKKHFLEKHELERKREEHIKMMAQKQESEEDKELLLNQEFNKAINNGNFMPLIEKMKEEVLSFHVNISSTVTLASELSRRLLTEDNDLNRIVVTVFFVAKTMGITDETTLGDLIVASFFHHLGLTQMDSSFCSKVYDQMTDEEKNTYFKHPGLSQHMIKKSGVEISPRAMRIILDHHEHIDGLGYPIGKREPFIEPLALILGHVAYAWEYAQGKISGQKTPLNKVAARWKLADLPSGPAAKFGDTIFKTLISIVEEKNSIIPV